MKYPTFMILCGITILVPHLAFLVMFRPPARRFILGSSLRLQSFSLTLTGIFLVIAYRYSPTMRVAGWNQLRAGLAATAAIMAAAAVIHLAVFMNNRSRHRDSQ